MSIERAWKIAQPLQPASAAFAIYRRVYGVSGKETVVIFTRQGNTYALRDTSCIATAVLCGEVPDAEILGTVNRQTTIEDIFAILGIEQMETAYKEERLHKLNDNARPILVFTTVPFPGAWYVEDMASGIRMAPLADKDAAIEVYNEYLSLLLAAKDKDE